MYFCISFTHKNTDLALREKLNLSDEEKLKVYKASFENENLKELFIINTCNRVEFFGFSACEVFDFLLALLSKFCFIDLKVLEDRADLLKDSAAIHHFFSVLSSLDSLVIGETQIVSQVKNAYDFAYKLNFAKKHLELALTFAIKCSALVRNQTQISKNPVSIASVAVMKAKEIFDLKDKKVLVIGSGEISSLAARHLASNKAKICILNRSKTKAQKLAKELNATYASFSELQSYVNAYDLIFSATNSKTPIITKDLLVNKNFKRYFFDMAVPRDVNLAKSEKIEVFAVDDLKAVVEKNLVLREKEAYLAYKIISEQTSEFFKYLSKSKIEPLIKSFRIKAKNIAEFELNKALKKGYLKNSSKTEARKLINQVLNSFLHHPTVKLKNSNDTQLRVIKEIFDLD